MPGKVRNQIVVTYYLTWQAGKRVSHPVAWLLVPRPDKRSHDYIDASHAPKDAGSKATPLCGKA